MEMTGKLRLIFVAIAFLVAEIIADPDPSDSDWRIPSQIHDEAKCYDESGKAQVKECFFHLKKKILNYINNL